MYKKINETTGEIAVPGIRKTLPQLLQEESAILARLKETQDAIQGFKDLGIKTVAEVALQAEAINEKIT